MLLGSTMLWGISFPLMRHWQEESGNCPGGVLVSSLTLVGLRTLVALALLAVFQPNLFRLASSRELKIGLFLGLVNFLGCLLQVLGLAWTSPALSGFLTSLNSAWVPVIAVICFRIMVPRATLFGLAVGVAGAAVLQIREHEGWTLGLGESLTILSSVMFAFVVVLLDRLGKGVKSSHLTVGFIAMTGIPGMLLAPACAAGAGELGPWVRWLVEVMRTPTLLLDVLLLSALCTALAYHWMTSYQPRVSASRAALIYLLEPVFATALSLVMGYDEWDRRLLLGGGLILGGNLLVEWPMWGRPRAGPQRSAPPAGKEQLSCPEQQFS
jgi:drug/metabolite transporter (DMT)-like permease